MSADGWELNRLLRWIRDHPGLTKKEIEQSIRDIPYPEGDPDTWKPPYDGTRLDVVVPTMGCLEWKLAFLELRGDIYASGQKRGKSTWDVVDQVVHSPFGGEW